MQPRACGRRPDDELRGRLRLYSGAWARPGSSWSDFPPRPERFANEGVSERGDIAGCLGDRPRLVEFWLPFTDTGRHFYAIVVLGADASPQVRTQAFEVLDSLRFDTAVQPSWRASD